VAPAPWHVHIWLVDSECPLPPTENAAPTKDAHVSATGDLEFISEQKRLVGSAYFDVPTDYTEICPLLQTILSVTTSDGQQHQTT
jgi:hypothetical protein